MTFTCRARTRHVSSGRMRLSRLVALASVVSTALATETAWADGDPIVVLTIQTPDAFDQAEALTGALKRAMSDTPGRSLDDKGNYSVDLLMQTIGCAGSDGLPGENAPDKDCQDKIPEKIGRDRYVWGRIVRDGDNVKGTIFFYQKGVPMGAADVVYTANLTDPSDEILIKKAHEALDKAGAGAPPAHFRVEAGTESGEVFVDDVSVGKLEDGKGQFLATAGTHKLLVKLPDGRTMSAELKVVPDGSATVTLTPPPPPGKPLDLKIPFGFGFLAVGLGFGAAGLYSSLQFPGIQDEFDVKFKGLVAGSQDGCDNPSVIDSTGTLQSLCDRAAKHTLFQEIFYPVAGASAVTGVILLAVSDWKSKPATKTGMLTVLPVVGPTGAYMTVAGGF